jgi:hypothetical protein
MSYALTVAKEIGGKGFAFYIVSEEPFKDAGLNGFFDVLADPGPFLRRLIS